MRFAGEGGALDHAVDEGQARVGDAKDFGFWIADWVTGRTAAACSSSYALGLSCAGNLCGPLNNSKRKLSAAPCCAYTCFTLWIAGGSLAHSGKIVSSVPAMTITGRGASSASQ